MATGNTLIFALTSFVVGAMFGSFIGAMTYRMQHKMDWIRGRSQCDKCKHKLAVLDLIPVLSFVFLCGKCRYCHKKISRQILWVELLTGITFAVLAVYLPLSLAGSHNPMAWWGQSLWTIGYGIAIILALILSIALAVYDIQTKILPDKLVFPLIAISLIASALYHLGYSSMAIGEWGIALAFGLSLAAVYGLIYILSRGKYIGLGDVKLSIALGWLVPWWWGGLFILFLSNLLGSLVAIPGMIAKKLSVQSSIAFGQYLVAATWIALCFGGLFLAFF